MEKDVFTRLKEEEWYMLADDLEEGEYALFVASGLSAEAGLPTGNGLTQKIIQKLYRNDSNAVHKFRNNFGYHGQLELPKVTQLINNEFGRERLIKLLCRCVDWNVAPAYVHQCISLLAIKIREKEKAIRIITPNYDSLVEDSITSSKDVIVLREQHSNAHDAWPWVLKVHGCIRTQPEATVRITDDDLARPLESWAKRAIKECLSRRGLVVIGYGATDINVKQLIEEGIQEADRPSFWVSPGEPPDSIVQSLALKGGRYIKMDATSFFRNTGLLV